MPPRKATKNTRTNTTYYNRYNTTTWPTTTRNTYACNSPKFRPVREECQWRIGSYQNVYSQFARTTSKTSFSPSMANKWTRYVNTGARVYKFNNNEFTRYFGNTCATYTSNTARQWMRRKYGTGIKDVTRTSTGWLVAATKTVTTGPFRNYNW